MSFRRELNSHDAWKRWLEEEGHHLERAGIPWAAVATEPRMREFLATGRVAALSDTSPLLTSLTQQQFDSLLDFVLKVHPLSDDMSLFDAFEARRKSQAP